MAVFGETVVGFTPSLGDAFKELGLTPEKQESLMKWSILSISGFVLGQIQRAFGYTQAQPGGKAWQGVSQAWAEKKTAEGRSAFIGTYRGFLSDSFTGSPNPLLVKATEAVKIKDRGHRGDIGTTIPYGGWFNDGTKFMPKRSFIPVDTFVLDHWRKLHSALLEKPELIPNV